MFVVAPPIGKACDALIFGVAQVTAALMALIATIIKNTNKQLRQDLKNYSREIYILNEELVSVVNTFSGFVKEKGINDKITPLKDSSIIDKVRVASTGYLGFNSSTDGKCDEKLRNYMQIDNVKEFKPQIFQYNDRRMKEE